ncbi:MAG: ferritin-like domain-containing protein [Ilumatobacteraceae bacterium]|nr:ferritin-like domain-containing protein [Ilumatobacteraceae bacterium]
MNPRSRRQLLAGVLAGSLASLGVARSAVATSNGYGMSDADVDLMSFAMGLELLRDQHKAYAEAISGFIGASAQLQNPDVIDAYLPAFDSSDTQAVLEASYELESVATATHGELMGLLESVDAAKLIASILAVTSRHCTVVADAAGQGDDLDAMLTNTAEPLQPADS